jgi:serine/threonine protein kinase
MVSQALSAQLGHLGRCLVHGPEQAKGKQVDERAEIWAFGVLYEILTGERLFKGEDVSELGIAQAPHVPIPADERTLSLFLAHPQPRRP